MQISSASNRSAVWIRTLIALALSAEQVRFAASPRDETTHNKQKKIEFSKCKQQLSSERMKINMGQRNGSSYIYIDNIISGIHFPAEVTNIWDQTDILEQIPNSLHSA